MRIGIVGAEAAKFTVLGEKACRAAIADMLRPGDVVVSGGCHLGGVDIWAEEAALDASLGLRIYLPAARSWEYYKARNMLIAQNSDHVVCFAVDRYPPDWEGMLFTSCYHCKAKDHVKSGGCWTTKYARRIGVPANTVVVENR